MLKQLCSLSLIVLAGVVLVLGAPSSTRPTQGKCWTNGTHYGDGGPYATQLPSCWVAICNDAASTVTVATPCTAGPDIEYSGEELQAMLLKHCYPSARGELTGRQCCGGYPICAHDSHDRKGPNRARFNLTNFFKVLFDWQLRGEFNYY